MEPGTQDNLRNASVKFYETIQQDLDARRTGSQSLRSQTPARKLTGGSQLIPGPKAKETFQNADMQKRSKNVLDMRRNGSPASSRSHSTRTNSTVGSQESGTRETLPERNGLRGFVQEKKIFFSSDRADTDASSARVGSPSRMRAVPGTRTPSFSSDSPFSSDSELEHGGQRTSGSRLRRFLTPSRKQNDVINSSTHHRTSPISANGSKSRPSDRTEGLKISAKLSSNSRDAESARARVSAVHSPMGRQAQVVWTSRDRNLMTGEQRRTVDEGTVSAVDRVVVSSREVHHKHAEPLWVSCCCCC